jgi:DNA-binding NarL/FixJ family response regulator
MLAVTARLAAVTAVGALGVVPKPSSLQALLHPVRAVAGHPVTAEAESEGRLQRHRTYEAETGRIAQRLTRLTAHEREVLTLLAQGSRAADIAADDPDLLATVRGEIQAILTKLNVDTQLEAIVLAHRASGS